MITAKIILFKNHEKNLVDKLIKFFTNSNFRHAGIVFPVNTSNLIFESTGWSNGVISNRKLSDVPIGDYISIDLELDHACFDFAMESIGKKYDWRGFFLWNFNRDVKSRFYCFEFILEIVKRDPKYQKLASVLKNKSVSGQDIYNITYEIC
jgi:hypothetical protein